MKTLLLATHNLGKVKELSILLAPIECVAQSAYLITPIEESGLSFIENAILKARHASAHTQLPALADDSGLVVEALNGQPGIFSARFAGKDATDQDNVFKLLAQMQGNSNRQAYFYCAIALVKHADDPTPVIATGRLNGIIHTHPLGNHGFGYDPIFYLPDFKTTMAELSTEIKNQISHRAMALQQLKKSLY